jgi:nicotinamide-nucleotide amidase
MSADQILTELAERVGLRLDAAKWRLATAESCTGGWISKAVTDIPNSSRWFDCGYVTYSNDAKVRDLGVSERTLEKYGAVSEECVREMAAGALRVSGADIAVAVSGIAGPSGGTEDKPVGTVWFGLALRLGEGVELSSGVKLFPGNRESIRRLTVDHALRLVLAVDLPSG